MVDRRRIRNVVYYDYTPTTIDYDVDLDALAVARADIYSPHHAHRLALVVVATDRELGSDRAAVEQTIARARPILEALIEEHRGVVDALEADLLWVFNLVGQRTR
jgi:hypothetical protein